MIKELEQNARFKCVKRSWYRSIYPNKGKWDDGSIKDGLVQHYNKIDELWMELIHTLKDQRRS